ncbi:hypothetical protein ACOME3_006944 [Neoechinorhynchus agilis]
MHWLVIITIDPQSALHILELFLSNEIDVNSIKLMRVEHRSVLKFSKAESIEWASLVDNSLGKKKKQDVREEAVVRTSERCQLNIEARKNSAYILKRSNIKESLKECEIMRQSKKEEVNKLCLNINKHATKTVPCGGNALMEDKVKIVPTFKQLDAGKRRKTIIFEHTKGKVIARSE